MSEGYNSFYGGRRGASFVIVKKYSSIKEMVDLFKQGGNYKTVNYDEYVLIDTVSKNDADNGKVYRRGYEYNNDFGGAIFIGQIVGPAGMAPHTELKTINEVKSIETRDDFTYRRGEGSYEPTENLVPGKYQDENGRWNFHDEIQWAYCSVRDLNSHESTAHIGFKFPYTVIEIDGNSVDPYYNRDRETKDFINENLVTRTDDTSHPFFQSWNIAIPKGIKGDTFKNLKVISANTQVEDYTGKTDDINENRKIVVYEYYNYDSSEEGERKTLYLGDYNMISNVILTDDGTLTIEYTHNDTSTWNKKIKWITQVSLNADNGKFIMNFNDGTKYETQLKYPKEVSVDGRTGMFNMKYSTGDDYNNRLIYPNSIELVPETGKFTQTYTDNTKYQTQLKYPIKVNLNSGKTEGEGNQKIQVTYSTGEKEDISNPINYIIKIACDVSTGYHLYVLYSDPTKRALGPNVTYQGRTDWVNLGFMGTGNIGCIAAREDDMAVKTLIDELPAYSA